MGPVVQKESILIVEDDFIVGKVIEKNLLDLGYTVSGLVATGRDALTKVASERPDLVLMDIRLQGDMDGIEASGKILASFNIPVVFLTAFSDKQTFDRALSTAPYGYIVKPFSASTLSATIKVALNKKYADGKLNDRHFWLDSTMDSLQEGIITIDRDGKIILLNYTAGLITGWTTEEARNQPLDTVLAFVDPITGQSFHYSTGQVILEGIVGTIPGDSFVLSKKGTRILISDSFAFPIRNGEEQVSGAVIVLYPKNAVMSAGRCGTEAERSEGPAREISIAFDSQKGQIPEPSDPVDAAGWCERGNYLLFLRRYGDAINAYENAISKNRLNYQSWYGKGTALAKLDRVEEALHDYDEALSIHPRNPPILNAKGVLLKKTGRDTEAERCFEMACLYLA